MHVGLDREHAHFGIFHALHLAHATSMIDGLQHAQEETVADGKEWGGVGERGGEGDQLVEKLCGTPSQVVHGLGRRVEVVADADVRATRMDAEVALAQQRFLLHGALLPLGYDAGSGGGSQEVAGHYAMEMYAGQTIAQLFGLSDAFGSEVARHLSLQDALQVLLGLAMSGDVELYHVGQRYEDFS